MVEVVVPWARFVGCLGDCLLDYGMYSSVVFQFECVLVSVSILFVSLVLLVCLCSVCLLSINMGNI